MAQINPLTGTDVFARQQELAENQSDIKEYLVATLATSIAGIAATLATLGTQLSGIQSELEELQVKVIALAGSGRPWIRN